MNNLHIISLRTLSVLLISLLIWGTSFAQDEEGEVVKSDTTEISWGAKKLVIISDSEGKRIEVKEDGEADDSESREVWTDDDYDHNHKQNRKKRQRSEVDLLGFDLGVTNYYVDGTYGVDAAIPELEVRQFRPGAHVALHLLPTRVSLIGRGAVNLKSAITVDWSNYYFTNDITLREGQEQLTIDTTGVSFSKNKLMTRYAQIPLLLSFNTAPGTNDGVEISVGGYAGVLWGARTKQVSDAEGKVKINGEYNLNPFRYGLTARVDFKWFDFYLNYNLSEMFEEGNNPTTQTFTAGINIIDF